jgi:hypothetical protein
MMTSEAFSREESAHISDTKQKLEKLIKDVGLFEARYVNDWNKEDVKSVELPWLKFATIVAGGCIASLLRDEAINDIDAFILKPDATPGVDFFERMFATKSGRWTVKYHLDEDDDYSNEHIFATAFNHDSKVQYIKTDFVDRKALIDHFDLVHCMASYQQGILYITRETYDAIMKKHLIVNGKKKVKKWRLDKFRGRNWKSQEDLLIEEPPKTKSQSLEDMLNSLKNQSTKPLSLRDAAYSMRSQSNKPFELDDILRGDCKIALDYLKQTK